MSTHKTCGTDDWRGTIAEIYTIDLCENPPGLIHGVCAIGMACACSSLSKVNQNELYSSIAPSLANVLHSSRSVVTASQGNHSKLDGRCRPPCCGQGGRGDVYGLIRVHIIWVQGPCQCEQGYCFQYCYNGRAPG